MALIEEDGKHWVVDANNNRCSVEYFGSQKAAQKALDSLIRCSGCSNCIRCFDCRKCSGCYDCSYCNGIEGKIGWN